MFELENVSVEFENVAALRDVTLRVGQGERVVLVGASGAGKSTLLALLNGSLLPTRGRVRLLGKNFAQLSRAEQRATQRHIGSIYQQFHLVPNLPVIHNVNAGHLGAWSFARAAWSLARPSQRETARRALAQVGIAEKIDARTESLSGGQQQRVAIARVLVQNPQAILADEPISSLDPERGREIMDLLRDISVHSARTLVCSLHAVEYALTHFDRVIGLRHGQKVFDLPTAQVSPHLFDALYQTP